MVVSSISKASMKNPFLCGRGDVLHFGEDFFLEVLFFLNFSFDADVPDKNAEAKHQEGDGDKSVECTSEEDGKKAKHKNEGGGHEISPDFLFLVDEDLFPLHRLFDEDFTLIIS